MKTKYWIRIISGSSGTSRPVSRLKNGHYTGRRLPWSAHQPKNHSFTCSRKGTETGFIKDAGQAPNPNKIKNEHDLEKNGLFSPHLDAINSDQFEIAQFLRNKHRYTVKNKTK